MGLILSKTAGVLQTVNNWMWPGLMSISAGMDLGRGRSVGAVAGEQAAWYATDRLVDKAMNRFKFPGKCIVSFAGKLLTGLPTSYVAGEFMERHAPIHRFHFQKQPSQEISHRITT